MYLELILKMNKSTYVLVLTLLYAYQVPTTDKMRKESGDFRFKLRFPSNEKVIHFADIVARKFNLDPTTISRRTKLNVINDLIEDGIIEIEKDVELGCIKTSLSDDVYNSIKGKILYAGGEE